MMTKEQAIEMAKWLRELNASGYAGCTSMDEIVDRRERPDAIPVQANSLFGVVEPRSLQGEKVAGDLALKFRKWLQDVSMSHPDIPVSVKYKMFLNQKNIKK